jgi:hypothetical protein
MAQQASKGRKRKRAGGKGDAGTNNGTGRGGVGAGAEAGARQQVQTVRRSWGVLARQILTRVRISHHRVQRVKRMQSSTTCQRQWQADRVGQHGLGVCASLWTG